MVIKSFAESNKKDVFQFSNVRPKNIQPLSIRVERDQKDHLLEFHLILKFPL